MLAEGSARSFKAQVPMVTGRGITLKFRAHNFPKIQKFPLYTFQKTLSTFLIPCSVGCDMGSAKLFTKLCTTTKSKTGSGSPTKLLPTPQSQRNHRCSLS